MAMTPEEHQAWIAAEIERSRMAPHHYLPWDVRRIAPRDNRRVHGRQGGRVTTPVVEAVGDVLMHGYVTRSTAGDITVLLSSVTDTYPGAAVSSRVGRKAAIATVARILGAHAAQQMVVQDVRTLAPARSRRGGVAPSNQVLLHARLV